MFIILVLLLFSSSFISRNYICVCFRRWVGIRSCMCTRIKNILRLRQKSSVRSYDGRLVRGLGGRERWYKPGSSNETPSERRRDASVRLRRRHTRYTILARTHWKTDESERAVNPVTGREPNRTNRLTSDFNDWPDLALILSRLRLFFKTITTIIIYLSKKKFYFSHLKKIIARQFTRAELQLRRFIILSATTFNLKNIHPKDVG